MVGQLDTFNNFLASEIMPINIPYLAFAVAFAAVLAFILSKFYVRYGSAISNRQKFSSNFILLSTTTTLIITIVKSSLALSLGLVGALSIVRFRSAIKEPEELAFLFLCIAIGLGLGAHQVWPTTVAFSIILSIMYGKHILQKKEESTNLHLTISGENVKLSQINSLLKKNCTSVFLKRFDEKRNGFFESSFVVGFESIKDLEKTKEDLHKLSKSIEIVYLDSSGLY